ncbi:PH and SEC7 domain-containing protein 1-like isoform X3, partial [Dinothrombium tinctorium]
MLFTTVQNVIYMTDAESTKILANKLYNLNGFKKLDVANLLARKGRYWQMVAAEFFKNFDFSNESLDAALRKVFELIGNIDGVEDAKLLLKRFGLRYRQCNRTFISAIVVSKLTVKLMALNNNLHGKQVDHKVSCDEFIECVAGLNDGDDFAPDILKELYESIRKQPLYLK